MQTDRGLTGTGRNQKRKAQNIDSGVTQQAQTNLVACYLAGVCDGSLPSPQEKCTAWKSNKEATLSCPNVIRWKVNGPSEASVSGYTSN